MQSDMESATPKSYGSLIIDSGSTRAPGVSGEHISEESLNLRIPKPSIQFRDSNGILRELDPSWFEEPKRSRLKAYAEKRFGSRELGVQTFCALAAELSESDQKQEVKDWF